MNAFQLVIAGVVAVALLGVFFQQLAPLFLGHPAAEKQLRTAIEGAKVRPGSLVSAGSVTVSRSDTISVSSFSDLESDLAFECDAPQYCCVRGVDCATGAFWSGSRIRFDRSLSMPAFVRCAQLVSFFGCTVFFGASPAQVDIKSVVTPPLIDLAQDPSASLAVDLSNVGIVAAEGVQVDLSIYRKTGDSKELVSQKHFEVGEIPAAGTAHFVFSAPVSRAGDLEAVLSVASQNAGSDSKTVSFSAVNSPQSPCRALTDAVTTHDFDVDTEQCRERFACDRCEFAFQCVAAWEEARPDLPFSAGDYSFAAVLTQPVDGACD